MDTNEKTFSDPRSDDDAVLRAVSQIPSGVTDASLWTRVANDPSYRPFHRAVAVYELFRRHIATPVTLQRTALLLAGGAWLPDAAIEKIESMAGETPVRIPAGGAAFIVRLPGHTAAAHPEIAIYLALDRTLDPRLLRDALTATAADPKVREVRIMEFALVPERLSASRP